MPIVVADPRWPSITCPRCGSISYNLNDIAQGYCGQCHWWTSDPQLGQIEPPERPPRQPDPDRSSIFRRVTRAFSDDD